jgi:hypothetical protein
VPAPCTGASMRSNDSEVARYPRCSRRRSTSRATECPYPRTSGVVRARLLALPTAVAAPPRWATRSRSSTPPVLREVEGLGMTSVLWWRPQPTPRGPLSSRAESRDRPDHAGTLAR